MTTRETFAVLGSNALLLAMCVLPRAASEAGEAGRSNGSPEAADAENGEALGLKPQ